LEKGVLVASNGVKELVEQSFLRLRQYQNSDTEDTSGAKVRARLNTQILLVITLSISKLEAASAYGNDSAVPD
jgi:hypothetical protein